MSAISSASRLPVQQAIYARISWRLLPLLILCYLFAYLDRINIGFAKLQMQADIGLSDAAFGIGAGIFFLGYALFEIPSNPCCCPSSALEGRSGASWSCGA